MIRGLTSVKYVTWVYREENLVCQHCLKSDSVRCGTCFPPIFVNLICTSLVDLFNLIKVMNEQDIYFIDSIKL